MTSALSERPAAVVLLAGALRTTPLLSAIRRSPLDLPLARGRTILDLWCDLVAGLAAGDAPPLTLRVLSDASMPLPAPPAPRAGLAVSLEHDRSELRGTAGVLADLAAEYRPEDYLLVCGALQLPSDPLATAAAVLAGSACAAAILCPAREASGVALAIRCGALRTVSRVGFVDLKEQALPKIAAAAEVRVVRGSQAGFPSVRTLTGYIATLRRYHARPDLGPWPEEDPFAEQWTPRFAVVEDGADVAPGAVLGDAVVLAGGRVETDAAVLRSVVAAGGVARRGRQIRESVLGAAATVPEAV